MFHIISRPPTDNFNFKLLYQTLHTINNNDNIDVFYAHSYHLEHHYYQLAETYNPNTTEKEYSELLTGKENRSFLENNIKNKTVLIAVKDHLSGDKKFCNDYLHTLEYFKYIFNKNLDKKIIFCTSLENLHDYIPEKNVKIVHMGGDIVNQAVEYKNLKPVIDKNLNSKFTFVALNRNFRIHRIIFLCLLFGLKLEKNGMISCMFKNDLKSFEHHLVDAQDISLRKTLFTGFERLKKYSNFIKDDYDIYDSANDNASNFNKKLNNVYKNTFLEIVSETTFFEKCFLITEKTANCFLGYNFPIILNSKGSVNFLRNMGFDMFDDIVNHNYDNIDDPFDRLYHAIYDNKDLLLDSKKIKKLWCENIKRFEKNVNFLQNNMYDFYSNRFKKELITSLTNEI